MKIDEKIDDFLNEGLGTLEKTYPLATPQEDGKVLMSGVGAAITKELQHKVGSAKHTRNGEANMLVTYSEGNYNVFWKPRKATGWGSEPGNIWSVGVDFGGKVRWFKKIKSLINHLLKSGAFTG